MIVIGEERVLDGDVATEPDLASHRCRSRIQPGQLGTETGSAAPSSPASHSAELVELVTTRWLEAEARAAESEGVHSRGALEQAGEAAAPSIPEQFERRMAQAETELQTVAERHEMEARERAERYRSEASRRAEQILKDLELREAAAERTLMQAAEGHAAELARRAEALAQEIESAPTRSPAELESRIDRRLSEAEEHLLAAVERSQAKALGDAEQEFAAVGEPFRRPPVRTWLRYAAPAAVVAIAVAVSLALQTGAPSEPEPSSVRGLGTKETPEPGRAAQEPDSSREQMRSERHEDHLSPDHDLKPGVSDPAPKAALSPGPDLAASTPAPSPAPTATPGAPAAAEPPVSKPEPEAASEAQVQQEFGP